MAPRSRRWSTLLFAAGAVVLALTSCSSGGSPDPAGDATPSGSASAAPPRCPNFEGGACLGPLTAGTSYTTEVFTPELTYRVPVEGWSNYEDTPGNFLLVPPGNDLPGVNAGTSDFIGVYTSVVPGRIAESDG